MGEILSDRLPEPITSRDVAGIDEITAEVEARVKKYQGEALVRELVDYIALHSLEIILSMDSDPVILTPNRVEARADKLSVFGKLMPGVISRDEQPL